MEMLEATMQPSTLKPCDELLQRSLVNPSYELMLELAEQLQKHSKEVLQVTTNDISGDALEKCLQQSSVSSRLESVCEEAMLVSVREPLHDPLQQSSQALQKMSFELVHVELPLQESIIKLSQELAQKPLQDICVNDMAEHCDKLLQVVSQDVCDKPMLDIVPEPIHDPIPNLLQVQENEMSSEPTKEHVEQQELSQKPFHVKFIWKNYQMKFCMSICHVVRKFPEVMFHFNH